MLDGPDLHADCVRSDAAGPLTLRTTMVRIIARGFQHAASAGVCGSAHISVNLLLPCATLQISAGPGRKVDTQVVPVECVPGTTTGRPILRNNTTHAADGV